MVTGKSGSGKQPRIDCLCKEFGAAQLSTGNIFRDLIGRFNATNFTVPLASIWNSETGTFRSDEEIAIVLATNCRNPPSPTEVPKVILGAKAKYYVDNGLFVPDALTNELFASAFVPLISEGKVSIYLSTDAHSSIHFPPTKVVLDGFPRTLQQWEFLDALLARLSVKVDFVLHVELDDDHIVRRATGRRICPTCQVRIEASYSNISCRLGGLPYDVPASSQWSFLQGVLWRCRSQTAR